MFLPVMCCVCFVMVLFYYYGTVIQRYKCVETSSGDLSQLHAQSPSTTIDHPNLDSMITFPKSVQAHTDNSSPYTYNNAPVHSSNSVGLLEGYFLLDRLRYKHSSSCNPANTSAIQWLPPHLLQ